MALNNTGIRGQDDSEPSSRTDRVVAIIKHRGRDGSLALLLGSVLLAWALRSFRNRTGRGAAMGVVSMLLLGYGMRQRMAGPSPDQTETGTEAHRDTAGSKRVSDEAHAEVAQDLGAHRNADESASVYQSETDPNPRGMTDRSDSAGEDEVDFVEGKSPETHRETHLEDDDAHDTRLHPETDDEQTQVDISESAMADETSEAAGPHPEQAYPAREGTDPEPTSEEAPERVSDESSSEPGDEPSGDTDESETADDPDKSTRDDDEQT